MQILEDGGNEKMSIVSMLFKGTQDAPRAEKSLKGLLLRKKGSDAT
jgi:hypothetical protein